ncbi:MAG: hypothetical protein OXI96_04745 [Acidimicrobiaceae bacterium]|nr:hypothetical protein [Acidimicrobiaceae bacterium]
MFKHRDRGSSSVKRSQRVYEVYYDGILDKSAGYSPRPTHIEKLPPNAFNSNMRNTTESPHSNSDGGSSSDPETAKRPIRD